MKRFASVLAFLVVFLTATGPGLAIAAALAEDAGKGRPHPVAGLVVGVFSVCLGIFGGAYVARTTSRHYSGCRD